MQAEMRVKSRTASHTSFEDWYRHGSLSPAVRGVWPTGALNSTLIEAIHPGGDLSDPAHPDIVLGVPLPTFSPAHISADIGFGKIQERVREHHFFLLPAHTANIIHIDGTTHCLTLSLPEKTVRATLESAGVPSTTDFGRLYTNYFADPFLMAGMLRLHGWCGPHHASHGLARESLLLTMMVRLAELARTPAAPAFNPAPGGLTRWQTKRVIDRLHTDLAASPPLDELALLVGLSQFHFCRAFKKSMGLSPIQYLIAQRMERAARLLAATQLPIAEIAQSVGYEDPAYFTRLFRQKTGMTPSAVRS